MYTLDEIEEIAKKARNTSLKKCLVFLLIVFAIMGTMYYYALSVIPQNEQTQLILIGVVSSLVVIVSTFTIPNKKYKDTKKRLEAENEEEHRRKIEEALAKLSANQEQK